jgi:hypothetical protein
VALLILSVIREPRVMKNMKILIAVTRNGHEHDYGKEVSQEKADERMNGRRWAFYVNHNKGGEKWVRKYFLRY